MLKKIGATQRTINAVPITVPMIIVRLIVFICLRRSKADTLKQSKTRVTIELIMVHASTLLVMTLRSRGCITQ